MFVGSGKRLAVLEHAHQRQDLLTQALVLVYDTAQVFSEVAQFGLGILYTFIASLDNADDFAEVLL